MIVYNSNYKNNDLVFKFLFFTYYECVASNLLKAMNLINEYKY